MKGDKMKFICLLISLVFLSCAEEIESQDSEEIFYKSLDQVEICHNPESSNHKQACTSKCSEPNMGNYSFCWTLTREDCFLPHSYEWQRESCHFFD